MNSFTFEFPLRWSDMDANGHVNNAVYSTYLEEARIRMFADLIPVNCAERMSRNFVVAEQSIKFIRPLAYRPEPFSIEARVTETKASCFSLESEIKDAQTMYLTAKTLMVAFDSALGRVRRMTETEHASLSRFQEAS